MRSGRCLAILAATAALAAPACAAPVALAPPRDPGPVPAAATPADAHTTPAGSRPPGDVALCTVLPTRIVGELIGAGTPLDASGAGAQCTWRAATPTTEGGADPAPGGPVVQGAMLHASAYHAGRPDPHDPDVISVADLRGLGDEAFVVSLGDEHPTTLYVRDGQRALSLWLDDVPLTPHATERSLARMASLLLNLA